MPESQTGRPRPARPRSRRGDGARLPPTDGSEDFPVIGIGASAGGLEACRKLFRSLPTGHDMACILVQHLDPTHASMMVDLLSGETPMTVRQAADGMPIERNHVYVIPPGAYLSIQRGALHLSEPQERHGARLPFDFLLHSLAEECGPRAVCVVLSGTGADGSLGLAAVKEKGGLVIVQDPAEAGFDGMPHSAILTGAVDIVLPVAGIAAKLVRYDWRMAATRMHALPPKAEPDSVPEIIDLLRSRTAHDFTHYKLGTLQRRIERRMAMVAIEASDTARYLGMLQGNAKELDLLAKDLLINVTSFFRDPKVFAVLADKIVPDLIRNHAPDQPLRIWIAGCSTGEETYSLAMIFHEAISAGHLNIKLQLFASDVDPDAIADAREGLYPKTIEADVSKERLGRFFTKENDGYRVLPELRAVVVFTVQDVLADPPFSRLDLVSCRNLLIYLQPEAQAKVLTLFHFALREGGVLLLGSAETVGAADDRFAILSKPERLYRHTGRSRPGELSFVMRTSDGLPSPVRHGPANAPSRQSTLAELCRKLVMEAYAPAAVLINRRQECLYFLGPTDRYLHVAPGHPTNDLLAIARPGLRTKLRAAIQRAVQENARIGVSGGLIDDKGRTVAFGIDVQPTSSDGEPLLLICFTDASARDRPPVHSDPVALQDVSRVTELEQELNVTRMELQGAIRNLELAGEEQKAINEEALSVNEEYQSTNEELLTSKEELQSLNEELTALNGQLQETLEKQRTTANDLQNVLYSTDVATLFLDTDLNIRFFTPATRSLFSIIPGDVGRPLADLNALAPDGQLIGDARTVLQSGASIEREIEAGSGAWYIRRILPYRTQGNAVEGVVITFADITERRHSADVLGAAKRQAESANVAKSRFLAAASHDLRQPLQTLVLLQGLLAKAVDGEKAQKLVLRLDETLGAMSGMLNALLDINHIEAGTVRPEIVDFPIKGMLDRLCDEFAYHAQAKGLVLHVVPCSLSIRSDPHLLEQMIRNLLSNALKYTMHGKVLLGCRRHGETLRIEIGDTGIGVPAEELQAIFEEYHQLDNAARERSRGLGLGLAIVQRLGVLLDHRIDVRSQPGKGSIFAVDVALATGDALAQPVHHRGPSDDVAEDRHRKGTVLIVEDDPEVRELLELMVTDEGHSAATAPDAKTALELVARGTLQPDLVVTDYNLPGGLNGLQLAAKLRETSRRDIPAIILTGDISTSTSRDSALQNCVQLNKPAKLEELTAAIGRLLPTAPIAMPPRQASASVDPEPPVIFVVDDDSHIRDAIRVVLEEDGRTVEDYATCEAFLEAFRPGREACLLVDAYLPGMNGIELLRRLREAGHPLPAIMITGSSDVSMAVQAMKAGASDFIEKPIGHADLLAGVEHAIEQARDVDKRSAWRQDAAARLADLTPRQLQIMALVLAGAPSKNIAADLHISRRTVENHRAAIMRKTGSKSLPALARLALAAAGDVIENPRRH